MAVKVVASACVAPDLFVVQGVPRRNRRTYLLWKEGRVPSLVIEVTSRSTHREDEAKKSLYARFGVREYFRFDPEGEYLSPPLQGFRLGSRGYRRMRPAADGSLRSHKLDLTLALEAGRIRVIDSVSGTPLLRFDEQAAGLRALEEETAVLATRSAQHAARAAQRAAALRTAEERVAQLEEELARLLTASTAEGWDFSPRG